MLKRDRGKERTARPTVFLVEDNAMELRLLSRLLAAHGNTVTGFANAEDAAAALSVGVPCSVLVTDLALPGMDGVELVRVLKSTRPSVPAILLTGQGTVASAVDAMRAGAFDFLLKPLEPPDLLAMSVQRALEHAALGARNAYLEAVLDGGGSNDPIVGGSPEMRRLKSLIGLVAGGDSTALIEGESGTGKELVARSIHSHSSRAGCPFVAINCGALTSSLLESELFGYEKGAFTGAAARRRGLLEAASSGTVFLDEVGSMSLALQAVMLRVLQEREIRPVGATSVRAIDVRFVSATNVPLSDLVEQGRFREDLMYRLDVIRLTVPPLRDRKEDVPALVSRFLSVHCAAASRTPPRIGARALEELVAYDWPGNVRELSNALERLLLLTPPEVEHLPILPEGVLGRERSHKTPLPPSSALANYPPGLQEAKAFFTRQFIHAALERNEHNTAKAARELGLDPSNLRRMLRRLDA